MVFHLLIALKDLLLIVTFYCTPGVIPSAIRCPFPNNVQNAQMNIMGHIVNDTISYRCLKGYWYNGTNPRVCTPSGSWSGHTGYCEKGPECTVLETPRHGGLLYIGSPNNRRPLILASCWPGYTYQGSPYLACIGNNNWNGSVGTCIEVARLRCKELEHREHMVVDYELLAKDEAVHLKCMDGYMYKGSETMTCEKNGSWSGLQGACLVLEGRKTKSTTENSGLPSVLGSTAAILFVIILIALIIVKRRNSASARIKNLNSFQYLDPANKSIVESNLIDPDTITLNRVIGNVGHNRNPDELNEFICEATIMKGLTHPNVLPMLGISFIISRLYVVLPFMKNGDLKSFITENPFNLKKAIGYMHDIVKGMCYLASMKFVHRDLAARNCMVNDSEQVVIGDFGLARDIYQYDYYRPNNLDKPVPVKWMALECLDTGLYTTKSDIWSFGVVAWEIFTNGAVPYADIDVGQLKRFLRCGGRLDRPVNCPPVIFSIFERCWQSKPEDRPAFIVLVSTVGYFIDHPEELVSASGAPAPMTSSVAPRPPSAAIVVSGYM